MIVDEGFARMAPPPDASGMRGVYMRTLLVATFLVPFALAALWVLLFFGYSAYQTGRIGPVPLLPVVTLFVSLFLAPAGFGLGLLLVALRHRRGPLGRALFAGVVVASTLVLFVAVGAMWDLLPLLPLAVAAPTAAALVYRFRRRLGIAELFADANETIDVGVFE